MPLNGRGSGNGSGFTNGNKVMKSIQTRRDSKTSSLPTAAQEHLGQLVQHEDSNNTDGCYVELPSTNGTGFDGTAFDGTLALNPANALINGGSIGGFNSSLHHHGINGISSDGIVHMGPVGSQSPHPLSLPATHPHLHPHPGGHPVAHPHPHSHAHPPARLHAFHRAGEVAFGAYGDLVKIDSALCKKLASELATREPVQRRSDQKLNLERRGNVEALLAHVTGEEAPRQCKNCHKGHGPWTQCVVYEGQMCGSCTNCWFNASGSRCTFQENVHFLPQSMFAPSTPVPGPELAATPTPAPTTQMATYPQSTVKEPSPDIHPVFRDFSNWELPDPAGHLVNQAMDDGKKFNRMDRFVARIEAAAKELGMRIAEYDEWLRTPDGMAEHQQALGQDENRTPQGQSGLMSQSSSQGSFLS